MIGLFSNSILPSRRVLSRGQGHTHLRIVIDTCVELIVFQNLYDQKVLK